MESAVPCKMETWKRARKSQEKLAAVRAQRPKRKQCMPALWKLMSPQESVWNLLFQENHEDHIVEKGFNSLSHDNLVRKFIPMPQVVNIPDARKLQWRKNGRSPRRCQHGNWIKAKSKRNVFLEAQKEKNKVHCATLMDICHFKNDQLEPKHQKYKGRVVLRGDIAKDDSDAYSVFHRIRIVSLANDSSKSYESYCEITRLCRTSRRRSISLHQNKMEDAPRLLKKSKVRVSRYLDASSTT